MKVKVSIIVPVFNVERYLSRCLNSLINQSLKDIEIILVDDGSMDNSSRICDTFAAKDKRIKVIHKQNEGLGFARNTGLDSATGEYIAYCDSDDYVELDSYERLYDAALKMNADVVYGSFFKEVALGVWEKQRCVDTEMVLEGNDVQSYLLDMIACAPYVKIERKHDMSSCMSIYRMSVIKNNQIRFTSERVNASEDTIYNIDFLKNSERVGIIPYTFYHYCLNGASLTKTFFPEKMDRFTVLRQQMIEHLGAIDRMHERSNRFYIGYARSFIICCFNSKKEQSVRSTIKRMVDNPVWEDVKREYKPAYLPPYARLIYWLTIHQQTNLLIITGWLMAKLFQIRASLK